MDDTDVAIMAGILTTLAGLPQFLKALQTRDLTPISTVSYAMLAAGIMLWIFYAIMIGDVIMMLANCLTIIPVAGIIFLKTSGFLAVRQSMADVSAKMQQLLKGE